MTADQALQLVQLHLSDHTYSAERPALLVYLLQQMQVANAQSPKADAVRQWIDAMVATAALNPSSIEAALTEPPHSFAEVVQEAVASLNSQPSTLN
jgi:hypothetical protein